MENSDKTAQLKEVLNKKLSSDEIEKKLKEENKKSNSKEKVKIPYIKNIEHDDEKESNLLLYSISIIAFLLFLLTIYLFVRTPNEEQIDKKILTEQENIINTPNEIKEFVKDEIMTVLKNDQSENQITETPNEEETKEIITEKIVEKTIEKEVILEKGNFKKYYNSLKFNTLKCYNFKTADINLDSSCLNDLPKFLNENKNAIRFEIIPVLAEDDNKIFEKMKNVLDLKDEKFVETVKEYMYRGLSRDRVLETSSQIKSILGEDIVLTPTNYYVKSQKNNKGVIIRAYH